MATSINMRGKAATSGAAGGGGKSRLHRAFDDLMDHPNPATQQQFEEDYAMADPSSNLFNPRKVLSNRNNLKNYANKKGMPESRVNAMATKIAKAQMDDFHKHVSQSFEKASSQMARSAQRASETISVTSHRNLLNQFGRISNAQSVIQRVSGGRFQTPVLAANNLSASGARLAALGGLGASADVALIGKLGARGSSAAFSGDRRELRKMEKNLDRIASNTGKEVAVLTKSGASPEAIGAKQRVLNSVSAQREAINRARAFSPNARKLRGGLLGDIGMGALLEGAGEFAAPVAAAGALGYAFLRSPNIMSNMASGIVSSASPYMNARIAAANLGRAGGLNSQNLLFGLHPNGPYSPKWMSKYGIGPQKALGILSGYGIQQQYSSQSLGIVKAIARAKYLPYMGEESYGSLEKSLNLKNTLGLAGGNNAYFNKMSGVLKFAVKHGLDSASVLQTMNKSLSMAASQGAMSLSYRGLSSFQERLMGGGGSYFRSGAGVLSTEGQLNAGTNMIGRVPFPTVAAMEYARYRNGGKLPTSTGGMKKFLGVARYNQLMKNKGSAQAIRNIIAGDKGGMYQVFSANIRELLRGDPQLQAAMDRHALMQEGVPKYAWSTFAPGLGVSTTNYNQIQGTRSALNVGVSFPNKKNLYAKILALGASRHIATDIYAGATAAGVNPYLAAVVAQHESGFKNFLNTGSGAAGPMQIMPANVKSLLANPKYRAMYNDIHGRNAKLSYLSSIILKQSLAEAHGNIKRGLEYYAVGEGNWKSNALIHTRHGTFYAKALARSDVSSEMRRLTNSSTLAENTPSRTLAAKVLAEQQKVAAGYNSFESMIINMPKYATAMALLDQNATGAAAALGRIAGNVAQGAGNLATVHPSHSPIHYVSPMEARTGVNP